jgi:8-oxo-dGTP pyrophosphatase MutT (NUDIX family)
MNETKNVPIIRAEVSLSDRNWQFSQKGAVEIEAYWQRRTTEQPKLFNGDILLLDSWSLLEGGFHGECLTTDYKSFLYWREHDKPDCTVTDFFPAAALHSQEGWLILGRMGPDHSSAGLIYPPCGSLHPDDIVEGKIDLDGNILREIKEETGLTLPRTELRPPILIFDGSRLAYMRPIKLERSATEIVNEIESYLARAIEPELSEIIIVKGRADIVEAVMPSFTVAYIEHAFA